MLIARLGTIDDLEVYDDHGRRCGHIADYGFIAPLPGREPLLRVTRDDEERVSVFADDHIFAARDVTYIACSYHSLVEDDLC